MLDSLTTDEPPVHLERDVLQDVLRVVGQLVDVEQRGVGFHEWLEAASVEVEADLKFVATVATGGRVKFLSAV